MKKQFYFLILLSAFITSCEKDDFCIEPITPNLIIRFYDATTTSDFKSVSELYVWPDGRDSVIVNQITDSITIPLDVNNNQTIYKLSTGNVENQLTITYDIEQVFVSRSCGYKAIFNNVTVTSDNIWIQSLSSDSVTTTANITTINDESAAHVQVYH
ncbi:MAG: hypothetical protein JXR05_12350 [Flavobacteriaceae bacterium]